MAFDVGANDERERRIVRTAFSEGLEALCVGPSFIHIRPVRFDGVTLNGEVETSRRAPCQAHAGLTRGKKLVSRTWFEEQTAGDDEHLVFGIWLWCKAHGYTT